MTDKKPVYKFKSTTQTPADKNETAKAEADKRQDRRQDQRQDSRDDRREDQREDRRDDRRVAAYANRDQDPNHPANNTQSPPQQTAEDRYRTTTTGLPSEEMLTEQEKDAAAGGAATAGDVPGVGPVPASETTSGPVETIEDQGIGPRTPYPTGNPPPPTESVSYSQGIKGAADKPSAKPGSSSAPAGQAPRVDDRDAAYRANRREPAR